MPIPDYQAVMLPLLKFAGDRQEHSVREAIEILAVRFQLSAEEKNELLPSGQQATFDNWVAWAGTYLKKAGLLEATKRAHYQITNRGLSLLDENPDCINNNLLRQYEAILRTDSWHDHAVVKHVLIVRL